MATAWPGLASVVLMVLVEDEDDGEDEDDDDGDEDNDGDEHVLALRGTQADLYNKTYFKTRIFPKINYFDLVSGGLRGVTAGICWIVNDQIVLIITVVHCDWRGRGGGGSLPPHWLIALLPGCLLLSLHLLFSSLTLRPPGLSGMKICNR